jgi:hypothetical protein
METCRSCSLEIKYEKHQHDGLCCDCFDETLGMPPSSRSRPRPVPLDTPFFNCQKLPDGTHNAETCQECSKQRAATSLIKKIFEERKKRLTSG